MAYSLAPARGSLQPLPALTQGTRRKKGLSLHCHSGGRTKRGRSSATKMQGTHNQSDCKVLLPMSKQTSKTYRRERYRLDMQRASDGQLVVQASAATHKWQSRPSPDRASADWRSSERELAREPVLEESLEKSGSPRFRFLLERILCLVTVALRLLALRGARRGRRGGAGRQK